GTPGLFFVPGVQDIQSKSRFSQGQYANAPTTSWKRTANRQAISSLCAAACPVVDNRRVAIMNVDRTKLILSRFLESGGKVASLDQLGHDEAKSVVGASHVE